MNNDCPGVINTIRNREVGKFFMASVTSGTAGVIPVIAVDWFLIGRLGLDLIFGLVLFGLGILSLVVSFISGAVIDRFSRKAVLFTLQAASSIFMLLSFFIWLFFRSFLEFELILVLIVDEIYNSILWSSITAFAAGITSHEQYGSINSLIEFQGQLAPIIGGVLAALLISSINIGLIFLISSALFAMGAWGYRSIHSPGGVKQERYSTKSYLKDTREGISYLLGKRYLLYLLLFSSVPFIGIKIGNYVKPIYILQGLHASPWVLGISDSTYALVAVISSLMIPVIVLRIGKYRTLILSMAVYAIGSLFMMLIPLVSVYLLLQSTHGFGNPGSRIVRKTITMESVENRMLGRVSSFISTATTATMLLVLLLYIYIVSVYGPFIAMGAQSILVGCAAAGLVLNERKKRGKSGINHADSSVS